MTDEPHGSRQSAAAAARARSFAPAEGAGSGALPAAGSLTSRCGDCLEALAHRLTQPLTALRGPLELALLFEGSRQEDRRALQQALEQTTTLAYFLEALRDLAGACVPAGPSQVVRLDELAAEVAEECTATLAARGMEITFQGGPPARIEASPIQLREAIAGAVQGMASTKSVWSAIRLGVGIAEDRACLTITGERPSVGAAPPLPPFPNATPGEEFAQAAKAGCLETLLARRLLAANGGTPEEPFSSPNQQVWRVSWPLVP